MHERITEESGVCPGGNCEINTIYMNIQLHYMLLGDSVNVFWSVSSCKRDSAVDSELINQQIYLIERK